VEASLGATGAWGYDEAPGLAADTRFSLNASTSRALKNFSSGFDAVDGSPPREQRELRRMNGRRAMGQVAVVGLDIAKSVFQVHGVDRDGAVVVRRRLQQSRVLPFFATVEPCRSGIEACGSGHCWARELGALGHDVRLMAPSYVKPTSDARRTMRPTLRRSARR
jgi:transposase